MSIRFECVQRGVHWGVRDNENPNAPSGAILDLMPLDNEERVRVRWSFDDGSWSKSNLVSQSLSDSGVSTIWSRIVDVINRSASERRDSGESTGTVEDLYHDFANEYDIYGRDGRHSCESLVSLILTGKLEPVLGKIASDLGIPENLLRKIGSSS